jgi:hypothetical protein
MNLLLDWAMRVPLALIYARMTEEGFRDPAPGATLLGPYTWVLTAATFVLTAISLFARNPYKPDVFRPWHGIAFVPLCLALLMLGWGFALHSTVASVQQFSTLEGWVDYVTAWPVYGLVALAAACVVAALAAIVANVRFRLFTVALVAIQLYAAMACALVAAMAMTGTMTI